MKVNVTDAENSQKKIAVEVPREKINEAEEKELKKILGSVKLPGFRAGKAPKEVVRKQYSHKIKSTALESVINDSIRQALISNNINPLNTPNVSDVSMEDDAPLCFTVSVDVYPDIKLEKTDGFEVSRYIVKIAEEDIDKVLKTFRERNSFFSDAPEGKAAEKGDKCILDILGEGDAAAESINENDVETTIGNEQLYPGIEDALIGMKKGEVKRIDFTFPDYAYKDVAGKQLPIDLHLKELKVKELPALDDEFAKIVDTQVESMEALREKIRKSLDTEFNQHAKNIAFNKLLDNLISVNKFELPLSLIEGQVETLYKHTLNEYYYRYGIDPDLSKNGADELRLRHRPLAEKQIRHALLINTIALQEKITASDEEVQNEAEKFAETNAISLEFVREQMKKDSSFMNRFQNDIISDKVFEYLSARNTIKEVEISADEFEKLNAGEAEEPSEEETILSEIAPETEAEKGEQR
jgi:trigger factor